MHAKFWQHTVPEYLSCLYKSLWKVLDASMPSKENIWAKTENNKWERCGIYEKQGVPSCGC